MLQKIEVTEFLDSIKRSHPEFLESLKSEFLRTLKKEEFCRIMSHDRINSYRIAVQFGTLKRNKVGKFSKQRGGHKTNFLSFLTYKKEFLFHHPNRIPNNSEQ